MLRRAKRTLLTKLPVDSLLWYLYDALEYMHDEDPDWGVTVKQLRELKNDLVKVVEDLDEIQGLDDNTRTTMTLVGEDGDDPQCGISTNTPETIGEWKSRLSKLQTLHHFDPTAVKMIQEQKEKLFDRANIKEMSGQINPNIVNSD